MAGRPTLSGMGELQLVRVGDHEVVRVLRLEGFMKGFGFQGEAERNLAEG